MNERLTLAMLDAAFQRLWSGPTPHPLDQVADHFDAHCSCMLFSPRDTWTLAHVSARTPMHPDDFARILHLRGAYRDHPQLAGWRLFELPLPQRVLVFPWPPTLTDRELGEFLRREAARSAGHDEALISIAMPQRDCPRHQAPPAEPSPG